jgi:hypothetical protein
VRISRNLENGEVSLTELPSGRLEFKMSRIRLTGSAELRSECCSGMVLFGRGYRINHPKLRTKLCRKRGNEVHKRQGYKDD